MGRRSVLWFVFVGSRGGETRMCIVDSIAEKPKNPRQLALQLKVDYSTIRHSLRVLERNRLVYAPERGYGAKYRVTPEFEAMRLEYDDLKRFQTCTRDSAKSS